MVCKRCSSYERRLDELNKNFNALWDWLVRNGYDPEKILVENKDA